MTIKDFKCVHFYQILECLVDPVSTIGKSAD